MTDQYIQLLQKFPPRTINNEAELEATQVVIDKLLDRPKLSQDESDYLNVLGTLVLDYEQKGEPIPDIYGVELLKVLITERQLRQKDLVPVFKTESIVSDILNGEKTVNYTSYSRISPIFPPATSSIFA